MNMGLDGSRNLDSGLGKPMNVFRGYFYLVPKCLDDVLICIASYATQSLLNSLMSFA
jgi:hypothetical protein